MERLLEGVPLFAPAAYRCHVGLDGRFVDEDETAGALLHGGLAMLTPLIAFLAYVGACAFGCHQRFFISEARLAEQFRQVRGVGRYALMLLQPRCQLGHGDIRLRFHLGNDDIPAKTQFAAATGPSTSGRLDRARAIQPLLQPNSRGGRNLESSRSSPP